MTFDCHLLESPQGPVRDVAMRIDLFVEVADTAEPLIALSAFAAAQAMLAKTWKRTLLADGRCPRTCAAAPRYAGARAALAIKGGVTASALAMHLKEVWAAHSLCTATFTMRRVVVCLDGWDEGSCGELADAASAAANAAQLPDANPTEAKRSARRRFGRKRYIKPG